MIDSHLRPQGWGDFIGQDFVKGILPLALRASQDRGEPLDHVLLYGPSGLGKTTLAQLVGGKTLVEMHGQDLSPLGRILSRGERVRCVFIDEFHTLDNSFQELMIRLMNEGRLGTVIAATTQPTKITPPLRNRFGIALRLDFYSESSLAEIARNSAKVLELTLTKGADSVLAQRSRGTPRVVNQLLRRARDTGTSFTGITIGEALDGLGIDAWGIRRSEREYLRILAFRFRGGPTGLATLAGSMAETAETLRGLYEPYLLRRGLLEITSRGRRLTLEGKLYVSRI